MPKLNFEKQESEINKFSNFTTKIDDIKIHLILEKGSGPNPTPLLLMHGWPGSFIEFFPIINMFGITKFNLSWPGINN